MLDKDKIEIHDIFDNTAHVKRVAEYIDLCAGTPYQNAEPCYSVGQTVTSNGKGALKAGISLNIEQVNTVNGFSRYYGKGMWHLESDIK